MESYVAIFRKNRYLANLYRNLTEADNQTYCRLIGAGGEIHLTRRDVAQPRAVMAKPIARRI